MELIKENHVFIENVKFEKNKVMGLIKNDESEWGLKFDKKRVVLFESKENRAIINKIGFLTPSEAILIALFDGKKSNGDILNIASELFQIDKISTEKNLSLLLNKWAFALEEKNGNSSTPQYDPSEFIIPASEVDVKTQRLFIPIGMVFRITGDCMRNCIYCNIERTKDEDTTPLTLERWDSLAEEVKNLKLISVILTGGDPFYHKNFLKIVSYFTKRGIHPFITTKSYVSEEKAKHLKDLGINLVQVSIDAPVKEVVEFLTDSKGSFEQAISTIKNLINAGIQVCTNSVLTNYNVLLFPELIRLLSDLGVKRMKSSQFGKSYYKNACEDLFVSERSGQLIENTVKLISQEKRNSISTNYSFVPDNSELNINKKKELFEKRAICTGGRWGAVVLSDGKVIPCDEIPGKDELIIGNVTNQSIMDVWQSSKIDMYFSPPKENFEGTICYSCDIFNECRPGRGLCFRDSLKAYGSIYAPAPVCWKAPKSERLI